ncbi:MAG TPA: hypothetical protein VGM03_25180 [Phycisphaerae bacterium]
MKIQYASFVGVMCGLATAAWAQSNIDPVNKFAWGENVGWTNWRDANGAAQGVNIGATFLSGFIWGENIGFINVGDGTPANGVSYANANGSDFGVNVGAGSLLHGLAWGENVGWINFDGGGLATPPLPARIEAGRLRGFVWGENIGWINLEDNVHFVALATSAVSIVSANPPTSSPYGPGVFRDVLQNTTPTLTPQGIGVASTPDEGPITYAMISVTFSGPITPAPTIANITRACTDIAGNGQADCPTITAVSGSGAGPYLISLSAPPPPRECITFTFAGTSAGQKLQYQVLPGDTSLDGSVNTQDLLTLVQRLNDGMANLPANRARYNINRSNEPGGVVVNTQDLLRLVQLLNGASATQVFNGATVAACP